MTLRYSGPRGKGFSGDTAKAASLQRTADLLVGSVVDRLKAPPFNGKGMLVDRRRMADGSWIHVLVNLIGGKPIVRTWIESPTPTESELEPSSIIALSGGFIVRPEDDSVTQPDAFIEIIGYAARDAKSGMTLWKTAKPTEAPTIERDTEKEAGHVSWHGTLIKDGVPYETIISWDHGLPCRYRLNTSDEMDCSGRILGADNLGDYFWGQSGIEDVFVAGERVQTNHGVVGAGALGELLVYVAHVDLSWTPPAGASENEIRFSRQSAFSRCATFFYKRISDLGWSVLGEVRHEQAFVSPWFFSPSGRHAITVVEWGDILTEIVEVEFVDEGGGYSLVVSAEPYASNAFVGFPAGFATRREEIPRGDASGFEYVTRGDWMAESYGPPEPGSFVALSDLEGVAVAYRDSLLDSTYVNTSGNIEGAIAGLIASTTACSGYGDAYLDVCTGSVSEFAPVALVWDAGYTIWRGWMRFVPRRAVSYKQLAPRLVSRYDSLFRGNRLVAVDYGFDGQRRYVEQRLTQVQASYTYSVEQDTWFEHTISPPTTLNGRETRHDFQWAIDLKAELTINGEPIVSARGWIENGSGANGAYQRELRHGDNGNEYRNHAEARLNTERVWIFDVDARTGSAIYGKVSVSAVPKDPVDDPVLNFEDYLLIDGVTNQVTAQSAERTDSLVFVHGGEIVEEKIASAQINTIIQLAEGAGPLGLCPRMFSYNETTENNIPNSFYTNTGGFHSLQQLRCWREDAMIRSKGGLCARDPSNVMASFGFAENESINVAIYFNKPFNIKPLVTGGTPLGAASLRLHPIRAV